MRYYSLQSFLCLCFYERQMIYAFLAKKIIFAYECTTSYFLNFVHNNKTNVLKISILLFFLKMSYRTLKHLANGR